MGEEAWEEDCMGLVGRGESYDASWEESSLSFFDCFSLNCSSYLRSLSFSSWTSSSYYMREYDMSTDAAKREKVEVGYLAIELLFNIIFCLR